MGKLTRDPAVRLKSNMISNSLKSPLNLFFLLMFVLIVRTIFFLHIIAFFYKYNSKSCKATPPFFNITFLREGISNSPCMTFQICYWEKERCYFLLIKLIVFFVLRRVVRSQYQRWPKYFKSSNTRKTISGLDGFIKKVFSFTNAIQLISEEKAEGRWSGEVFFH